MSANRRLALFLDGTRNVSDDNTNVWRLKALCVPNDPAQLIYYSAGVGTKFGEKIRGGMFGYGLDDEVIDAYEWLIENYLNDDELFIFGFSRGAYTARSLSGLIAKYGLLQPGAPLGTGELYARYRLGQGVRTIRELLRDKQEKRDPAVTLEESWLVEYSRSIPIRFVGVWDTVGALGVPFSKIPVVGRKKYAFLETDLRIENTFAYHALAIDEHRFDFAPTLWTQTVRLEGSANNYAPRSVEAVEQRWFVGAHANVGGGYSSDLLPQIPLKWLMAKAQSHGLCFRRDVLIDGDEVKASIDDSYSDFMYHLYPLLSRRYYRPIGRKPIASASGDIATINETIDSSVFERWRQDNTYRPKNLVEWQKAHSVDIESLTSSVKADQPLVKVT